MTAQGLSFQVFASHFLQTNCVVVSAGSEAVCFDPGVYEDELDRLSRRLARFEHVHLVYTHMDFDHIIDPVIPPGTRVTRWHPEASAMRDEAEVIGEWERYDAEHYMDRTRPRRLPPCDRRLGLGTVVMGQVAVRVIPVAGHTCDSTAYLLPGLGLAVAGDMLSDLEPPSIKTSCREYYESLTRLAAAFEEIEVETVVPGHGHVARGDWRGRAAADLAYIDSVMRGGRLVAAGADLHAVAQTISYRGRAVPEWQMAVHLANLQLAAGESDGISRKTDAEGPNSGRRMPLGMV